MGLLFLLLLLMLAGGAGTANAADDFGIQSVHRSSRDPRRIYVVLARPLPAPADVGTPKAWEVRVLRPKQPSATIPVTHAEAAQGYAANHTVNLTLSRAIPDDVVRVEATLLLGNQPTGSTASPTAPLPPFEPVDNADDATIYFNGIVAPAVGAKTSYTIDTRANVMLRRFGATGGTRLGVKGELQTDHRSHVDPDSARIGVSLQRVRGFAPILTWDAASLEFDRNAKLMNLLSAASLVQTWGKPFTTKEDGRTVLRSTINLQAGIGLEVGGNLRNTVSVEAGGSGSGGIVRVVPSVGAWFVMPSSLLDRITISAEYTVRFPATRELFYETRDLPDDADPVPSLTKKPRHYVEASARFMATKWFGFEAKYKFGSLPPVFQIVDHSASFGLTFMVKQNEQ